jgi:hypothetical protein
LVQDSLGKKQDPTSKITNVKSAGGLALSQVVECLPSKREALTSTPSTAKKKKQNNKTKQNTSVTFKANSGAYRYSLVIEHWPSLHEVLGLIPSTTKNEIKQKKIQEI